MAKQERHKTKYPGVFFVVSLSGEKVYFIRYRKNGKAIEEKVGKQHLNAMTPAKASGIRAARMQGKEITNNEKRQKEAQKAAEWTVGKLWDEYHSQLTGSGAKTDRSYWRNHLEEIFAKKRPKDIAMMDTDRLRINLSKKLKPQTVKHVLALLRRIINYGVNRGYIAPLSFKITMPVVDNIKTEDLSAEQLKRLLKVLDETPRTRAAAIMKIALYSGMRKGEILKLRWDDIDFHRGFILIRDPKGKKDQKIPLNQLTRAVIESIRKTDSLYLFPAKTKTGHVFTIQKDLQEIKQQAGLPEDFRPMHGLRHLYATTLASSGRVDMFTLQKLLTHKSPEMTQRYAHLRDEALRKAADTVDDLFSEAG